MFTTVITPVRDLAAAKATWSALLGEPTADMPFYVGWTLDGQDVGLDPTGHQKGLTGPTPYWPVPDIEAAAAAIVAAGGELKQSAQHVGGGRMVALVADGEANIFGLIQDTADGAEGEG